MLTLKRLAWLKAGAPPRNVVEAALSAKLGGGGASYEKTVGPSPIVSVTDAKRKPALSLIAGMEPVQDLHGYENPWPAGGGKNIADYPQMIADGAVEQTDGSLYVASANSFNSKVAFQNDGTAGQFAITFIVKNDSTSRGVYPVIDYTDSTSENIPVNFGYTEYTTITKTTDANKTVDKIRFSYGTGTVKTWFYIQVEKGSTATDWTPYANICPISGRTGVTAYRTGMNLLNTVGTDTTNGYVSGKYLSNVGAEVGGYSGYITEYTPIAPSTGYIYSGFYGSAPSICFYDSNKNYISSVQYAGQPSKTFTTPSTAAYYRASVHSTEMTQAQLEVGSTASTYVPFNGTTTYPVTFPALTANTWDEEWETGWIGWSGVNAPDGNKIRSKGFIPVVAGETYRIVSSVNIQVLYYDANKDFLSYQESSLPSQSTFTTPSGCAFIRFYTSGSSYGGTYKNDIAINYPSTKTSYVPYSNTVYGGMVDIVSGTLTVTHADVDLGELTWTAAGIGQFYFESSYFNGADDPTGVDCYCDCYAGGDAYNKASDNTICTRIGEERQIWIYDSSKAGMTAAQFEAAMDGVRFVYPLANPETYQLDPQTVQMLKGANNLWNDAGDSTLTYVGTEP